MMFVDIRWLMKQELRKSCLILDFYIFLDCFDSFVCMSLFPLLFTRLL